MADQSLRFNCQFLNDYIEMVEDTESPRLFHVWSAISILAGALGRRCWFPFGPMNVYANHYTLLVGTPGTRKSTATSMAKRVLAESTGVRFAPKDTGGQRQGLVVAMQGSEQPKEFVGAVEVASNSLASLTLEDIAEVNNSPEDDTRESFVSVADKHHMMLVSGEFGQFVGQNNRQLLDFLTSMWDGEDYEYQIKSGLTTLRNPLLNILGATTPASIAQNMPAQAGGQGLLSRIILVYGARKYKSVPRPSAPNLEVVARVKDSLQRVYYELAGGFDESSAGRAYSIDLYDYALDITDSRFGYYHERRYTHLIKLAMCLAAGRGTQTIERDDYNEAHRILRATERGMPDALGEFGLNPLAILKQGVLEQIRSLSVVPLEVIQGMFHRDARAHEISEVVNDLHRMKQIQFVQGINGHMTLHASYNKDNVEDSMTKILSEA